MVYGLEIDPNGDPNGEITLCEACPQGKQH